MGKTMWAVFLASLFAGGGCGTQQVLLGGEGEYLLTAFDALAAPGEEVTLRARLQAGDFLTPKSGHVVRFLRGGRLFKAAETDGDGVAAVSFRPDAPGDYPFAVEVSPSRFADGPPAPNELVVACRRLDAPVLVVDMNRTLVASGFDRALTGDAKPMPGSPAAMRRLARRYTLVYLTHRPDYFGPKSRAWLRRHGYPPGAVLLSDIGESPRGSGVFKPGTLGELPERFKKIEIGIGDKVAGARAYHDNGLKAFLIVHIEPKASVEDLRQLAESLQGLPEAVQAVTGWDQIEKAVFGGAAFPRSGMVAELNKLADVRELQESMPLK